MNFEQRLKKLEEMPDAEIMSNYPFRGTPEEIRVWSKWFMSFFKSYYDSLHRKEIDEK